MVEDGVSGMFVDYPSIEEIGSSIEVYLDDRIEFDETSWRNFSRRFGYKNVVDHCIAIC